MNGCDSLSFSQEINIEGFPVSQFTLAETAFCKTASIALNNASQGTIDSLLWTMPGGTPEISSEENLTVNFSEKGAYTISLITWNEVGSDTLIKNIIIFDNPVAQFSYTADALEFSFNNESQEGWTYDWTFGDGVISNEISPSHIYQNAGEYEVKLITTNPCGVDTMTQLIEILSSVDEFEKSLSFRLYPNPANKHFSIIGDYISGQVTLTMLDGLGRQIRHERLMENGGQLSHNVYLSNVSSGLYFVKIANGEIEWIEKLIVH